MRTKAGFLIGAAVGYVLGTRAGQQQFEKIKAQAQKVWENPKVQEGIHDVETRATDFVKEKAPELKDKLTGGSKGDQDDLSTFTTAGSDETETTTTYPTGSEGTRI